MVFVINEINCRKELSTDKVNKVVAILDFFEDTNIWRDTLVLMPSSLREKEQKKFKGMF